MEKPLCWVPYYTLELAPQTRPHYCCKLNHNRFESKSNIMSAPSDYFSEASNAWRRANFETADQLSDDCAVCRDVPADVISYGTSTTRVFKHREWEVPQNGQGSIRKLMLAMDNICASSCIMCLPRSSHTISQLLENYPEWPSQFRGDSRYKFEYDKIPGVEHYDFDLLEGLLGDLRQLHLWGGEPLFSPNLPRVLDLVKDSKHLEIISFSTGLKKIKPHWVEMLAQLPSSITIALSISMEGPLDLNHWVRGIDPDEFAESFNILKAHASRIELNEAHSLITAFNVFAIPELVEKIVSLQQEWLDAGGKQDQRQNYRIASAPIHAPMSLNPRNLPQEIKDASIAKLTNALKTTNVIGRNMIRGALHELKQPANMDWRMCLDRINVMPMMRGDDRTFDYWVKKYL